MVGSALRRAWTAHRVRLLAIAVAWILAAVNLVRAYRFALIRPSPRLGDLHVYLDATRWLRAGYPLYEYVTGNGLGFTYPPFAALLLTPWGKLDDVSAETLWTIGTLLGVVVMGVVVGLRVRPEWSAATRWALAGLLVALFTQTVLVQANLATGQISLMLACLSLVECSRVFRSRRWGALSGIAAAVKLTPGLFLLFHLLVDRRRAIWSIGSAAAATVLAALVLPHETWTYWTDALWQTGRIGDMTYDGNLTWVGVVSRTGLLGTGGRLLGIAVGAATAAAALWNARRHWPHDPLAATAIVGCASVVAAPISWPHHAVWLLVWAVCAVLARSWLARLTGVGVLLVSLFWALLASPSGPVGAEWLAAVLVVVMSAAALVRLEPSQRASNLAATASAGATMGTAGAGVGSEPHSDKP